MSDSAPPPPPPPQEPYGQDPYGQPSYGAPVARPGGLADRFVAKLIDWVILFVVLIVVGIVIGAGSFSVGTGASYVVNLIAAVLGAVIVLGYFTLMESSRGQTVGKMVMKLRVVGPDGTRNPTPAEAFRRNIYNGFQIFGIIPVIGSVIGLIVIVVADVMIAVGISGDPARRQAWTDKFAGGTAVLKQG